MKRTFAGGLAAVLVILAVWGAVRGVRQAAAVTLRTVEIPLDRLPPAFDGYRVLLLSCLHFGMAREPGRTASSILRPERFDLAVIAGDIRRSDGSVEETAAGLGLLMPAIHARDGVFACPGNHDTPLTLRLAGERGITELLGTCRPVQRGDEEIWIGGVSDSGAASPEVATAFARAPAGAFRVLVAHNPDAALPASRLGVDLVLSGDTHGGQIILPFVGALVTKTTIGRRFVYGLNRLGPTWVYTNPGLGTTGLRIRLGRPPELTVLVLRRRTSPAPSQS